MLIVRRLAASVTMPALLSAFSIYGAVVGCKVRAWWLPAAWIACVPIRSEPQQMHC